MPDKILSTIKLFADDSKLLVEIDPDNPGVSKNIIQSDIPQVTGKRLLYELLDHKRRIQNQFEYI